MIVGGSLCWSIFGTAKGYIAAIPQEYPFWETDFKHTIDQWSILPFHNMNLCIGDWCWIRLLQLGLQLLMNSNTILSNIKPVIPQPVIIWPLAQNSTKINKSIWYLPLQKRYDMIQFLQGFQRLMLACLTYMSNIAWWLWESRSQMYLLGRRGPISTDMWSDINEFDIICRPNPLFNLTVMLANGIE